MEKTRSKFQCMVPGCHWAFEALNKVVGASIIERANEGMPALFFRAPVIVSGKEASVDDLALMAVGHPEGLDVVIETIVGATAADRSKPVRVSHAVCFLHLRMAEAAAKADGRECNLRPVRTVVLDVVNALRPLREAQKQAEEMARLETGRSVLDLLESMGPGNTEEVPSEAGTDTGTGTAVDKVVSNRERKHLEFFRTVLAGERKLRHRADDGQCCCMKCLIRVGWRINESGDPVQVKSAQAPETATTVVATDDPGSADEPLPQTPMQPTHPIFSVVRGDAGTGTPPCAMSDVDSEADPAHEMPDRAEHDVGETGDGSASGNAA